MSHSFIGYGEVKLKRGSVTVEFKRTCCREKLIRRKGHHTFKAWQFQEGFCSSDAQFQARRPLGHVILNDIHGGWFNFTQTFRNMAITQCSEAFFPKEK